jgi:hypothetical protein
MALVKVNRAVISKSDFEKQMSLLVTKFKLPETSIERNYVRIDKKSDGTEQYVLCKREAPIKIFDIDDNGVSVAATVKTYAERLHISNAKGKYNDEHKLLSQNDDGLEVGEIESWATI